MKAHFRYLVVVMAATVAGGYACQASAQNWIVGGAIGMSDQDGYDADGIPLNVRNDSSDTSLSVFGGYIFNDWLGVSGEYIDLGEANYAASIGSESGMETQGASGIDISAVFMKAVGSMERVTIFGRVGLFDFEQDVRWSYTDGEFSESWSGTDTGTSVSYGVGFAIPFGDDGWGFHGEYKMFPNIGDENEDSGGSGHKYDRSVFQFGIHKVLGDRDN